MRRALALVVATLLLTATGCGSDGPAVRSISVDDAVELVADRAGGEGLTVIDVRTPEEFAAGHLDGALNIDVQDPSFDEQIGELSRDAEYVVYCRTGTRSAAAAARMAELGFEDVRNVVDGGFAELDAAGAAAAG